MSIPKIYILDNSWRGCIVVIAFSEEEAREMMRGFENYDKDEPLQVRDLMTPGVVHVNLGDS